MKNSQQLLQSKIWIPLLAFVAACVFSPAMLRGQSTSIGPTVDECTGAWVDPYGDVFQIVCLLGDSTGLDATNEVDSYSSGYVPWVDSDTRMGSSGGFFGDSGYAVQDLGEQGGTAAYTGVSTTPTLNDVYTMYGNFGYCYDPTGNGGYDPVTDTYGNCQWNYPGNYLSMQGVVTLPGSQGLLYPKYVVVGVTYAPPGHGEESPYGTSSVQYTGTTSVGTSSTNSSSFSNDLGYTIQVTEQFNFIPSGVTNSDGSVTLTASQSTDYTQTQDTSSTVMINKSTSVEYGSSGYPTIYPPDGTQSPAMPNDYDVIRLWINPELVFTAYPAAGNSPGFIEWQGYAYDPNDLPGPDILPVQVGCLNGDFTTEHCQSQQENLNRVWAQNQNSPTTGGAESPAILPNTLNAYNILDADPFAYYPGRSTYTLLDSIPLPGTTSDGRFTQYGYGPNPGYYEAGQHFQYTITQMNTQQQTQGGSTEVKVKVAVSASVSTGFLNLFKETTTWTVADTIDLKNSWLTSLSQQQTVQNAVTLNGSDATNYVPTEFILYQDNLFGTFLCYPKNY